MALLPYFIGFWEPMKAIAITAGEVNDMSQGQKKIKGEINSGI